MKPPPTRLPGDLPQRLERDLAAQPEPSGYTIGAPILNPPQLLDGRLYVPVLAQGLVATLLPWPDGSEDNVAISADSLQQLIEEDVDVWPRCPRHPHALSATTVDGVASWLCPDDAALCWRIGELPPISATKPENVK